MRAEAGKRASIWQSEGLLRALLVAGSVIFAWMLVELPAAFNILDYEALQQNGAWGSMRFIRVYDPELLHRQPPYARYKGSSLGGDFAATFYLPKAQQTRYLWDLQYDRNGFRNDTDLKNAAIAVIGDSMVEGMTVSKDKIVTALLERSEGQPVANLGQYGYGPWQELVVLKRYALPLHPRAVVWVFSEATDLEDYNGYLRDMAHPQTALNRFAQRSFTRVIYRAALRFFAPARAEGFTREGTLHRPDGSTANVYFTFKPHALNASDLAAAEGTAKLIANAQQLSAAEGAQFLFVFAPDKFRVYKDACQFPAQSECGRWMVNDLPERLRGILKSVAPQAVYLDLTPVLADAAKRGTLPYYPDDVHWSPEGHRIAAEAIRNAISSVAR